MNIKNLTKIYLNTLPGLSEQEKEKIANFNANSDYVAFSASSFKLKPGEMGSVDYYNTGIPTFTDWGALKRVDEEGYVLVDLAEYNPWYIPITSPLLNQRKIENGNYERRNLDGINYRRTPDGFLEVFDRPTGKWEKLQHAIPVQVEADAKWVKGSFLIKGVEVDPYTGNHLKDVPLSNLLTEAWLSQHENLRGNPDDFDKIQSITFPEGAVGNNTDLFPWTKKETYFKSKTRVAVLPRAENERNRYWITLKKSDLQNQRDPVDLVVGNFNFFPHDLQGKQSIKLYSNLASLMNKVTNTNTGETNDPNTNTNTNTNTNNPPNNATNELNDYNLKVRQYNQQINEKLTDFQNRQMDLCEAADIEQACLFSLGENNIDLPEVVAQMDLIFQIRDPIRPDKQELTGDGQDQTKKNNNQALELRNTQLITEWENDFTKKRAAVAELKKILNRLQNPDAPEPEKNNPDPQKPNHPNSPNTPPQQKPKEPVNPIVENNQKSDENIKDISNTTSLNEARQKAKQEINNLLDRYGVKATTLNPTLWASQTNWETYLTTLTTVEQIADLVKKIKLAIIQQNSQNNRANQTLPLPQLKTKVIKEIEDLLKKYPQVKGENLLKGKNWKEKINSLGNPQQIAALARQLREEIISRNNGQKQSPTSGVPESSPTYLIISISLGVVGIMVAGFFLIKRRKIRLKQKRKVQK